ncbi:hypothetical protein AN478_06985 [Thiohalorhabdus denitrificans]|uniref:Uncharacterized protein n=1 Tax=Thiohalorhabdus denitrificans TaxID=381306 RepID=A0A0P9EN27_9GAMM|nr:MbcA/ParS/Xre antitoxin family protein [Thiohalorhabdus denitrificans]KPV39935.1 hypothetical protein AN478_06985 [Thiohalorhabdus denitrificans]SCY09025.1 Protein of unknown function [Thiohalorhabdus denitrificans]
MGNAAEGTPESREKQARVGLEVFWNIADKWDLTPGQQQTLLGVGESTFHQWRQSPPRELSRDTLERLSHIFGIYKDLHLLFREEENADSWIRRPNKNPLFGGRPALDLMLTGEVSNLLMVRRHLDTQLEGWA